MNSFYRFCCWLFCCKTEKEEPLIFLDEHIKLLPKNNINNNLFGNNELHCYGLIPEEMNKTICLEKLIDKNDFIKKICTGIDHVLILFSSGKLGIFGDNSKGQLGLPLKPQDMENKINELLIYIPKIQDDRFKKQSIIDIACQEDCSLLLIEANNKNYLFRVGYKEEYNYRDKIENLDLISLIELDYDEISIKSIYAFGKRSLFCTYKNEIFMEKLNLNMNSTKKYKQFHKMLTPIVNLAMGSEHCLILDENGNLFAMGDNSYGELGIENSVNSEDIQEINFFREKCLSKISKIAVGARNSLVLLKNGDLYAFGDNSYGQCTGVLTRYTTPTPIFFDKKGQIVDIFCGYNHCMVLLNNGDIYGWGDNSFGKLSLIDFTQNLNHPKLLHILKGKNVNFIKLGLEATVISTSSFERSLVYKEAQNQI